VCCSDHSGNAVWKLFNPTMMDVVARAKDERATLKRGVKRKDESNDDELRFTKRFNLLSIGRRYHIFAIV